MTVVFGGPDILAKLPSSVRGARRRAERLMRDTVVVRRKTGTTEDPDTFEVVPVFEGIYHGRAKLQTYDGWENRSESAGATVTVQRSSVHFPVGAFSMQVGDVVTVERSVDPMLVGRSYRVAQVAPVKSFATAYRVFVDENVGEEVPPWPPV